MMELLLNIENILSGMLLFALMVIGGLFITLKGRFFQVSGLIKSFPLVKKAVTVKNNGEGLTSFSAACTALSATVGTGNIAGVAGALSIGGAGAIFWMWVTAFTGMAVKFGEIALAVIFREESGGEISGGPMHYIKNGMPKMFMPLSMLFALAALPSVICSGNITQTNAAVTSFESGRGVRFILGLTFAVLTFIISCGGIKRIGKVTEWLVPIMALVYIILSFGVIGSNISFLPQAFRMIFKGAFNPKAVTGGAVGSLLTAVFTGASRGIFSNEAGLGTSAMAHSAAIDAEPETQGYFGIFEVFVDTVLLCTLTALTILCSGVNIEYGKTASSELVSRALSECYGNLSQPILGVMMCVFGFSSVIGWAVYGNICTEFLFGEKGKNIFRFIYPLGCIAGAVFDTAVVWRLSAFFNGIMLCINLPCLIYMSEDFLKFTRGNKNDRKNRKIIQVFKNG